MRVVVFLFMAALLAACGGSGGGSPTPTAGGGGPGVSPGTSGAGPSTAASAGPSGSRAPAGVAPDACALLTPADATAALGTAADTPDVHTGGGNNCTYGTADPNVFATVEMTVVQKTIFDHAKTMAGNGVTIVPVSGLGDDAFWFEGAPVVSEQLYVLKGAVAFEVAIADSSRSSDQIKAAEQVVAETALGRF
jgi:hypothetical protein